MLFGAGGGSGWREGSGGGDGACGRLREPSRRARAQTDRVFGMGTVSKGTLTTLTEADFLEPAGEHGDDSVQAVLAKLEGVVGLHSVKLFVK